MRSKSKLSKSMTPDEFDNGYWYATELKKFAEAVGIPGASKLRKDELEKAIKTLLTTGEIKSPTRRALSFSGTRDVERAIAAADPTIPIAHARTIDDLVATSASNARFVTRFMESFGMVAVLLTIVGVYGVIAYSVQQRRQEFAVRRALGAGTHEILQLVLAEGLNLAAVGIAVGLSLTVAAGLGLRHLLFGVSPFDPLTVLASIVVIAGVSLAASLVPAVAAARVEPRAALEE